MTSSVSARSRSIRHVDVWLYLLLAGLVAVGLGGSFWRGFARSSPRFLPSEGVAYLSGHPVAQAPPGRAAPAWSRWSTPRLNDLDQAGAVWLPPGVRWRPAGLRHPRAAGSRAGSPAAGGIFRVQGRRSCPPEARESGAGNPRASCAGLQVASGGVETLDPLESPVSGLLAWSMAALTCATRLLADGQNRVERSTDGLLLMLSLRNVVRAAEWTANNARGTAGEKARRAALAEFHSRVPDVSHARDVLEHFDEYASGHGRTQRLTTRAGGTAAVYSFRVERDGANTFVAVIPHRFDVAEIREACRQLVIALLALQEREENPAPP